MARKSKKKINRVKKCPACKGKKICHTCGGRGEVRAVQGRNKGAGFERRVAFWFSVWTGADFKRTPMSGGWAKTGDITPKDPKLMVDFPFSIECKNNETFSVQALIIGCMIGKPMKFFKDCWKQCLDDSKKSKKVPLLVMTSANQPTFAIMKRKHLKKMGLLNIKTTKFYFKTGYCKLRMVLLSDLLDLDYKTVKKAVR